MRCNLACTYCTSRSAVDDRAFLRGEAVHARIDAALGSGAREIVFSGGEPTMRSDLAALVAYARAAGAERVALETNAALVEDARARELVGAGLDLARVNLVGTDERVDAITRDPGSFARTMKGLDAFVSAGAAIEILAVVTRSTAPLLPSLPAFLAARPEIARALRAIELAVPVASPDDTELLAYEDVAAVAVAVERSARAAGIALRMNPGADIPPCVFPRASRSHTMHLYALTPGVPRRAAHTQVAGCTECVVRDRCSGFADAYLARQAPPAVTPIRDERSRRRLSLMTNVPEQIAHELVTRSLFADHDRKPAYDEIVRVNFRCNQSCTFCFVSTHLPAAADDVVESAIREAGARGSRIVISGGEPTLNPRILDYVRLAASVSKMPVSLQTNAIRLDDAELTRALVDAGVGEAFVSLHGCTADVSDAITEAPGTFVRTVRGIDNLAATRARLTLNFVLCEKNRGQIVDFVRFVAARWPSALVNVSFVAASTDIVPRDRALIPRYSDVLPLLADAVTEAARLGVKLLGFESMCGIPLCLVPASLDGIALAEIPAGFDRGEFLHADACRGCRYETTCFGIRRGYAELYGTSELRTVAPIIGGA